MATRKPAAQTVLVTGASSGIGEALARRFARAGHRLVLVARSEARLASLASALGTEHHVAVSIEPADLTQPDAPRALASALKARRIDVDILVNNAGVLHQGEFAAMPPERHHEMIALNVSALTAMLSHFVPGMVARGRGRILNVASIAAFQPIPMLATYAATKAFVLSLTESLADELKGTGVTATALCPGITDTRMLSGAVQANPGLARLPGFLIGDVEQVAEEGYRACMEGAVIRIPGVVNQAVTLVSRATPSWLLRGIAGTLARRAR
jgi:hypothetical protein